MQKDAKFTIILIHGGRYDGNYLNFFVCNFTRRTGVLHYYPGGVAQG